MNTFEKIFFGSLLLIALILMVMKDSHAAPYQVTFKNRCPDLVNSDWSCLNGSQACQKAETMQKIAKAIKSTGTKKFVRICSIDPKQKYGKYDYSKDFFDQDVDLEYWFGAWPSKDKKCDIDFACMPMCTNADRELERELRKRR